MVSFAAFGSRSYYGGPVDGRVGISIASVAVSEREHSQSRFSRAAAAMLGIAALGAYLLLPTAHALATSASDVAPAHAGVAYDESGGRGHSPLGCPICDQLGHVRHGLAAPVVAEAPPAVPVATAPAYARDRAHAAPVLGTAPARAPPARSLIA
jgi:hypothetical protein